MAIVGIDTLMFGTDDLALSERFFIDFGLPVERSAQDETHFRLPEGSSVILRKGDDARLPQSNMVGPGVREVIWGVSDQASLDGLCADLGADHVLSEGPDGAIHFTTDFGLTMGLRLFSKNAVVSAPEPGNAPGHVVRMNRPRRWRERALPKGISHVVFALPDFERGAAFMQERLGFRMSDEQVGFGYYLRADGANNHHNLLLVNASAPVPGMDGNIRFHHVNFAVEDLDEIMIGANHMERCGWAPSHQGLGRHRIDSALFYYIPCPAGGEAEYGADADHVDDGWVPRRWPEPLFAYAHFVHNLPPFLRQPPRWKIEYINRAVTGAPPPSRPEH
jgi:catechol 2,3-dioxygenase-like lactoylglutathione lyase family enzyme